MPIYEFYCSDCHMLFNFFSPSVDTAARPRCPRCEEKTLERRPARFATLKHAASGGDEEDELLPGLDEARMEKALEAMEGEMGALEDEEDPRQMAHFFRRFGEAAGMKLGPRMEEMLQRLEKGEDPDSLEDELGGDMDDEAMEDWIQLKDAAATRSRRRRPPTDDTLYFL
jgi:putative FmdB family regulatory protein